MSPVLFCLCLLFPLPAQEPEATSLLPAQEPEATSLLGQPLYRVELPAEQAVAFAANLDLARADLKSNPDDADALIWVGRRIAYLGHYREAIKTFSEGIARFPKDARFYRHRGHRYISTRQLDKAIADFEEAARLQEGMADRVEPDGLPNAAGIPTSTLQTNIYYHLGLAYYLQGRFEKALQAYQTCLTLCKNNDMMVATCDWLYMTLRRLDRKAEAERVLGTIRGDLELLESFSYHRRLMMYQGKHKTKSLLAAGEGDDGLNFATQGYGVGNWFLYNGDKARAMEVYRKVLAGNHWSAFGFIAAEADLARLR